MNNAKYIGVIPSLLGQSTSTPIISLLAQIFFQRLLSCKKFTINYKMSVGIETFTRA